MAVALTIDSSSGAAITGSSEAFAAFKLSIYNGALRLCRHPRLSALTEDLEARYLLDDVWNGGLVVECLEAGLWFFARRTSQLDYDSDLEPAFGRTCVFAKPGDWVRTMAICQDDRFNVPLLSVSDEAGYLYADLQTIYVAYVSSGPDYGGNLALWPQSFVNFVYGRAAEKIIGVLTGAQSSADAVRKESARLLEVAKSLAAMNDATAFPPAGSWTRARFGRRAGYDRGNRNSLIG